MTYKGYFMYVCYPIRRGKRITITSRNRNKVKRFSTPKKAKEFMKYDLSKTKYVMVKEKSDEQIYRGLQQVEYLQGME